MPLRYWRGKAAFVHQAQGLSEFLRKHTKRSPADLMECRVDGDVQNVTSSPTAYDESPCHRPSVLRILSPEVLADTLAVLSMLPY